jgi:hypothetical protein
VMIFGRMSAGADEPHVYDELRRECDYARVSTLCR